jgi:two-component system, sensor histidine kinase PhcS
MLATQAQVRGFSLAEFWRGAVRAWRHENNDISSGDTTHNGLPNDPLLIKRFNDEHRTLTLRNARVGCWFVILLMPLCTILDVLSYPQHLHVFVALRLISSLVGVILLLGIDRTFGQKYYSFYPALLPLIPSICVSYMMYFAKDPGSHYYAGLSFCMVSTCFVFNWTFREILATLSLIVIIYLAATLPHMVHNTSNDVTIMYLSNLTFIILNCIVLVATSFQHNSIRIREFLSRCQAESRHLQLSFQNDELLETINRLRDTEAQLDHSDRLASIGRLSAGIIHEINNPLNFVKSALYVLNKKTRTMPPDLAESVTNITRDVGEGVDRVAAIVSDLRTFAHPDQRSLHPVSVDSVLSKAERFLARDISDHRIQLSIQSSTGIQILADDREILQVLINLLQNSIDALHERPKPTIQISCRQVGTIVQLSVTDNGTGITQDQASKIFDPFYTTKEVGKGMGLGLSICYRMMQQMEGDIEVESIPGEYTRFTLIFQSATGSASNSTATSQLISTPV